MKEAKLHEEAARNALVISTGIFPAYTHSIYVYAHVCVCVHTYIHVCAHIIQKPAASFV